MKTKISKVIAVLLSVVILFTQAIPTLAALTEGSKYSYSTRYVDVYYKTGNWQTADGHTHNNSGQIALRNLSNGEPLYCIQIYEGCTNADATATSITTTNLWRNELTSIAREGITRVSIYGYPNYTYGYSGDAAQLATEILIWEFEIGARTNYLTSLTSFANNLYTTSSSGQSLLNDALKCYKKILEACANHQNRPSFSNQKITLKGTGSGNAVTITDSNAVLSNYSVKVSDSRIQTSVSGNKLTVYATGSGKLSGRIIFTKKNTDINSAFALTGANQALFYGTISDPVSAPLSVELSLGNLVIHKDSEDGMLEHSFKVTGPNNYDKTITTNSGGTYTLTDLPEGDYAVQELNTAAYHPHTDPKIAHVVAGATENVYFYNVLVKGKIEISKQGEILSTVTQTETGEYQPVYENTFLPGAEYNIYANEDITSGTISIAEGTLVDTVVTAENGKAVTKDLYLKADGTAQYKVVETKAPNGYVLDTEEHIVNLKMKEDGVDVTETLELFDARQKVTVDLSKSLETDELFGIGNNDEIKNVKFGLYAEQEILAADGTVIPEGGLIEVMSYDENINTFDDDIATGKEGVTYYSTKSDLPFGSYYIQELETDEHYIISDTKYPFTFSYTNQDEDTVNIQINEGIDIENMLKRGEIQGLKVDDNGRELEGAVIGLFPAGTTEFTKDTALMVASSDKDGKFSFKNIPVGSYIVKEISAPEGYIIDNDNYEVTISENEQIVEVKIVNIMKIGKLTLTHTYGTSPKTGADDTIIFITGALSLTAAIIIISAVGIKHKKKVK